MPNTVGEVSCSEGFAEPALQQDQITSGCSLVSAQGLYTYPIFSFFSFSFPSFLFSFFKLIKLSSSGVLKLYYQGQQMTQGKILYHF